MIQKIYIVIDDDDRTIDAVYREEVFKKEYKKHTKNNHWLYCYVLCFDGNGENRTNVSVKDIELSL